MPIELIKGDITEQEVDAIVNAANSRLDHVGGIARAIALAAGPELTAASLEAPQVPTGDNYATTAGNLKAKIVIHAVGPIWRGGQLNEAETPASHLPQRDRQGRRTRLQFRRAAGDFHRDLRLSSRAGRAGGADGGARRR